MRFEVTKRREETKGILNKRTEYYCVVNLDFTDEELDTLNEACLEKTYAVESVGDLRCKNDNGIIGQNYASLLNHRNSK